MRVAYLIPEGTYLFFHQLIPVMKGLGWEVVINEVTEETDLIFGAMLPEARHLVEVVGEFIERTPTVLWHWDMYSFVDLEQPHWADFLDLLHRAQTVLSCTYDVARQLYQERGVHSVVVPAWVNEEEMLAAHQEHLQDDSYAFYAASSNAFGKRLDWVERACELEGIPFQSSTNQRLSREDYLRKLGGAAVYVMPAFEESNGTIPAMEAVAMGVPLVISDLPSSREVFGDCPSVYYFPPADFGALRRQLGAAYDRYQVTTPAKDRILMRYGFKRVAPRLIEILQRTHDEYQP